jgi:hypothetical protein
LNALTSRGRVVKKKFAVKNVFRSTPRNIYARRSSQAKVFRLSSSTEVNFHIFIVRACLTLCLGAICVPSTPAGRNLTMVVLLLFVCFKDTPNSIFDSGLKYLCAVDVRDDFGSSSSYPQSDINDDEASREGLD